jgi:hypothetical protein
VAEVGGLDLAEVLKVRLGSREGDVVGGREEGEVVVECDGFEELEEGGVEDSLSLEAEEPSVHDSRREERAGLTPCIHCRPAFIDS